MDDKRSFMENGCEDQEAPSGVEDFSISSLNKEALKDLPEVVHFIERLQEYILRQQTLIHKLYNKLKEGALKKNSSKDSSTQTNGANVVATCIEEYTGDLVEDIKKAAENAVQQTGFVYEATSGMYYDYNTGYYYDAERGLYYDGHNGTYYYFDELTKSFQFHSQVTQQSITSPIEESNRKRKQDSPVELAKIPKKTNQELREEGECSESDSESETDKINDTNKLEVPTCDKNSDEIEESSVKPIDEQTFINDYEMANAWPPCLRVVVLETELDNLVVGSLFMVTCTGGTLGRAGDHAVLIPDINISKHHAKFSYSEEVQCYHIVDLGSRNGTFVNGRRISSALQESEPVPLQHGTVVRVGTTHLQCHVHVGRDTCADCEPGCAQRKHNMVIQQSETEQESKEIKYKSELKKLRRRFGLDNLKANESSGVLAPGYQDRAEQRRKTVGSQDHHAKTEIASVHQSIQSNNKGFQMLSKMGWAKGKSLGKDSDKGIIEPVLVEQRPDKVGLGSDTTYLPATNPKAKRKTEIWKKAQQRFQELDDD